MQIDFYVIFINLPENCVLFGTPSHRKHSFEKAASVTLHSNFVAYWCLRHAKARPERAGPGQPHGWQPRWTARSLTQDPHTASEEHTPGWNAGLP